MPVSGPSATGTDAAPPFWARPRFVVLTILVYCAVHFSVRMAMLPTLGFDDAEQALFAQDFAWSYRPQAPPLFTWLLIALGRLIGVDIVSISLIRYALLIATFLFTYATARRTIDDPRLSALAVYSFAAIYMFAFYAHHDLTHTTMMTAMLAVSWYVFARLVAAPRLSWNLAWYLALGATFGLGLLGKWNFVMFAAALPLACLVVPDKRRLVLTWKIVPALAVTALIALPTALSVLAEPARVRGSLDGVLLGSGNSHAARVTEGVSRLAVSVIAYPQPFLLLLVLFLGLALWRGLRAPATPPDPGRIGLPLLVWTMAISVALHLALVFALGAHEFVERLMQPPLFILPIALFMWIERGRPGARALNAYAAMLAALVAGTLGARITVFWLGADHCSACRDMAPFAALADDLRAEGFAGKGTILVGGFHVGGNMRVAFPQARIVDSGSPIGVWPEPSGTGQCLILWQHRSVERSMATKARLRGYLADSLGGSADAPTREGVLSEPMYGSKTRMYELGYMLTEATGDCR